MLKKFLLILIAVATTSLLTAPPQIDYSTLSLTNANGDIIPVQGRAAQFCAWLFVGPNTPVKQAVTGVIVACFTYTLYQMAKSIGTTICDLWHGNENQLSPEVKREVEREVIRWLQEYERVQVAARNNDRMLNAAYLRQKNEYNNEQPVAQPAVRYEDYDVQQAHLAKIAHAQNDATCVCGTCRKRRP